MLIKKPARIFHLRRPKPNVKQLFQAALLSAAVVGLLGGAAYAFLLRTPTAYVEGSTIRTATADLLVSGDGTNFARNVPGFVFDNAISGGDAVPEAQFAHTVYVKNAGSVPLQVGLSAGNSLINNSNIDLSKVRVIVSVDDGTYVSTFKLTELINAQPAGGELIDQLRTLPAGHQFKVAFQVQLEAGAAPQGAVLSNLTLNFDAITL